MKSDDDKDGIGMRQDYYGPVGGQFSILLVHVVDER